MGEMLGILLLIAIAGLFWLQRQDYYDIRLSGPLGRGAARLTGRPGQVSLEVANQGRYEASSPEELLGEQLGWSLPVSHLVWWVRGLPAPDSKSRLSLNGDSRLATLEPGAPLRLFLHTQPLSPLDGELVQTSYQAVPSPDGVTSYRLRGRFADNETPRIGLKGTARVSGGWAPLAYYVLRRPLAGLRAWTGL